jgi:hypothetical protein
VYFRHAAQKTHLVFDNENPCSAADVEPAMRLADAAGLDRLVAGHVSVAGPQAGLAARAPLLPGKDVLAYLDIDACQRCRCPGPRHRPRAPR